MEKESNHILSTTGIAFRKYPYSESSSILYWISSLGCIKTLAKGARKTGKSSFAPIDLFYECELTFYVPKKSDLYLLKEYQIIDPMLGLRKDWTTFLCSTYFIELVVQTAEERTPLPECYALLQKALAFIQKKPISLKIIDRYEERLLSIHGLEGGKIEQLMGQAPGGGKKLWETRKRLVDALGL
ncbi:recombinase [Methylacidiphilum kamchatkense Kam1]|uniref:DNA repair protein RecO n=1 Tax=Methylacidiphilum kamchatkense Kam1 TaxID=1202785 RepID=A0A0C1UTH8_9BACT|nr:DNA repair protein RecO [Methylacidiphilum kamchatkense]KIE59098.1 recombinase [Methylacidiphilum kamchatkense Kam1]QDQ42989.1 DNA repair protein RecO (recombination protein O) [Methylacidiphilum kamchatkense Kam1]